MNKRILLTGGSSGIGLSTLEMLIEKGARIGVVCNTHSYNLEPYKHLIKIYKGDLTDEVFAKLLVSKFIKDFGGIDVLINNAGTISSKNFLDLEKEDFIEMMDLHTFATYYLSRDAFNYMKDNGGGKIINVSSISVKYGGSENTMHYALSKICMEAMTSRFSWSGIKHNILVNCIRPGVIDTTIHQKLGRTKEDMEDRVKLIPLGRIGKPEEIAGMIMYLVSDYGNYTTGEIITISGGN